MSGYQDFLNEIVGDDQDSTKSQSAPEEIPVEPVEQFMISFDAEELTIPDPDPLPNPPAPVRKPVEKIAPKQPAVAPVDFSGFTGYRMSPDEFKELWIEAFEKAQKSTRVGELVKKLKAGEFLIDKDGNINPISKLLNEMGDDSDPKAFFNQKWV